MADDIKRQEALQADNMRAVEANKNDKAEPPKFRSFGHWFRTAMTEPSRPSSACCQHRGPRHGYDHRRKWCCARFPPNISMRY